MLHVRGLSVGYPGRPVLEGLDFTIGRGEFVGILGANGTGKSTLLKTIARLLPPLAGEIALMDRPLAAYSARELAVRMALMPQQLPPDEGWKVEEVVQLGRFPHQPGWALLPNAADQRAVDAAIARTQLEPLLGRPMHVLSGGQRQRVYLARALAQEAPLLLLDEPTSHLDMSHQLGFFRLIADTIAREGTTVVAVLHDLNMAAQFCRRLLVVKEGMLLADGTPDEVLEPGLIEEAFGMQVQVRRHPETGRPYIVPLQLHRRGTGHLRGSARLRGGERPRLHAIVGGGAGERLLPELYRLGFDMSVGVVNALDSDQLLAARLGLSVIAEAPFSAVSPESLAVLAETLRGVSAVVVGNVAWGSGNVGNLRALAALKPAPQIYLLADQPIADRDFTGGEAQALWEGLVADGARVLSQRELLIELGRPLSS
jgi:iron complex transport system ATP-binding protein